MIHQENYRCNIAIIQFYLFPSIDKYNTLRDDSMTSTPSLQASPSKPVQPERQGNINIKDNITYLHPSNPRPNHRQKTKDISGPITQSQIEDSTEDLHFKSHEAASKPKQRYKPTLAKDAVKEKLIQIETQKQKIVNSLKEVNQQISFLKKEDNTHSQMRLREKIAEDPKALRHVVQLVDYYRQKKKQLQERNKSHTYKIVVTLKQQLAESQKKLAEIERTKKEEKRNTISQRLNEAKLNRETVKIIESQTNSFVSKMLRKQKELQRHRVQLQRQESERRMNFIEHSPKYHHKRLQQLNRSSLLSVSPQEKINNLRATSLKHPIRKYKKTKWGEQLQIIDKQEKQQQLVKQITKRNNRKKRLQYGELVVSLFSQKKRARTLPNPEQRPQTSSVVKNSQSVILPHANAGKLAEQTSRQTQSFKMSPARHASLFRSQQLQKLTPEQLELQSKKRAKQRELRRQTTNRMKRLEAVSERQPQSKYQSHYQNYLGIFKSKKQNGAQNWNKILNSQLISKQQKYEKLMRQAESLQNRAKTKQQILGKSGKEADELFMQSISAKIMILQRM